MADRSRILNLPPDSTIDASGVGEMLFGELSKRQAAARDLEMAGKKAEVLTGIESKYRQAEAAQKNTLATEFEKMQQAWKDKVQEKEWAHLDEVTRRQGQGVLDVLGQRAVAQAQQGNILPEFVEARPRTPEESTGEAAPSYTPRPFSPYGAKEATAGFEKVLGEQYEESRIREQRSTELLNKRLLLEESLIGPSEVAQARAVAAKLEKAHPSAAAWGNSLTPGSMTKDAFGKGLLKLIEAADAVDARLAVAKSATEGRLKGYEILAASRRDVANLLTKSRLDKEDDAKLQRNIRNTMSEIVRTDVRVGQLRADMRTGMQGAAEAQRSQEELSRQLEVQAELETHYRALVNKQKDVELHTPPTAAVDDDARFAVEMRRVMAEKFPTKKFKQLGEAQKREVEAEATRRLRDKANRPPAATTPAPRG